jgi:Short C-terminal domain
MFRRRRGPSLLRTAAVVGTATVVSKGVSNSMDQAAMNKQQQLQQQQADQAAAIQGKADLEKMKAQMEIMQAQQLQADQAQATQAVAQAAQPDLITQLQQLTQLKQAGALSEDEFQAAKAKLLSS